MNKLFVILLLLLFSLNFANADLFLHEPEDENYSISNVAMTTEPRLNDFLAIEFDLSDQSSVVADNIHVHIKTYDEHGRLIHDYSTKLTSRADSTISIQNLNPKAIELSSGYEFFRTIPNQENTIENRLVTDDAGHFKAILFLDGCEIGQTQNCYFQTGEYTINILQEGLNETETFVVQGQRVQSFSIVQYLSTIANNTDSLIIIILGIVAAAIFVVIFILFVLKYVLPRLN
ncbi:hypothetical protein LCGC14_0700240 [marine sediment metagenome]|uniref:Uncharacterized protein n=1 Tax=marine sediment metagenome TaxID=412755 RepID=A0A0F9R3D3_9ZZZZ